MRVAAWRSMQPLHQASAGAWGAAQSQACRRRAAPAAKPLEPKPTPSPPPKLNQTLNQHCRHTASDTPLLDMLIWHERLLYPDEAGKVSKKRVAAAACAEGEEEDEEAEERSSLGALTDRFRGLLTGWRA